MITLRSATFAVLFSLLQPGSVWAIVPAIDAIWANDGGDKVLREERRAVANPKSVLNTVWDGNKVRVFGAKDETVSFNLVLESSTVGAKNVSVSFSKLVGPTGATIGSVDPASPDGVFDWNGRNIELFYVRYLKIEGLSQFFYDSYDERHVPKSMRRPVFDVEGKAQGTWKDRPGADKHFPDIAVPYELVRQFEIAPSENQSIWVDIYVPRHALAGTYRGELAVTVAGKIVKLVPVELKVRNFILPAAPSSKTMLYLGYEDINQRYTGRRVPKPGSDHERISRLVRDRHFQIAHRHRISMIDGNSGAGHWDSDRPRHEWIPRLDGSLFSPINGYDGTGIYVGNGIYSIGTYGSWGWRAVDDEAVMYQHTDAWERWFQRYFPNTDRFLYLADESQDFEQTQRWARWMNENPGPGRSLPSFATIQIDDAFNNTPDLDISASWMKVAPREKWDEAFAGLKADGKQTYFYNGKRPGTGTFAIEDDGIALREMPWGQFKKGIDRWFYWESTYYNDFQHLRPATNVFRDALTIGNHVRADEIIGKTGKDASNGDGLLIYPGTDRVFPEESYEVLGPIASLRLKHWRRGIQDVDYLVLAMAKDPARVKAIVERMVPKVLWDHGVNDPEDPTWVRADISWSTNPDVWEAARAELAEIIERP